MLPWLDIDTDNDATLAQVRDTSLGKLVRDDVLRAIMAGELSAGTRINEPDIAKRLGVSRVPVREALRELESTGLVQARKNAGVFVRQLSEQEVIELYDLRAVLDAYAGQAACTRISPQQLQALDVSIQAMGGFAKASNLAQYYAENLRFHWQIVEAAGNSQLLGMYRSIVQKLHLARLDTLSQINGMQASISEHSAIVGALRQRDAMRCHALLQAHVHQARARRAPPH